MRLGTALVAVMAGLMGLFPGSPVHGVEPEQVKLRVATALSTLVQAMDQLAEQEADAVVYDAPILRHLVMQGYADRIKVVPGSFEPQDYGIAFPTGSALREPVNQQLLKLLREPLWQDILYQYPGPSLLSAGG